MKKSSKASISGAKVSRRSRPPTGRTKTAVMARSAQPPRDRRRVVQTATAKPEAAQTNDADLSFEYVSIDVIHLPARALAQPNDRQHRQLMASITEFGFIAPLVISSSNELIVGEKRFAAARDAGLTRVPVVRVKNLTPLKLRKYRIADNRLNELRKWDVDALKAELDEIIVLEPDVNIEAMGYEVAEFDVVVQVVTEGDDPADIVPEAPREPASRAGDVWEIDGHRLGCGDARDAGFLQTVLSGDKAACVFADPPFNRSVAHMGGKGRIKHPEFVLFSGKQSDAEFQQFQIDWLRQAAEVAQPGALIYVASDWRALSATLNAAEAVGLEQINFCTWELTAPRLGSFYRSACEYFPVWRKPGGKSRNNVMMGRNGRHRSNCWHYPGANTFGAGRATLHLHPTVKPLALVMDVILDCTARDEVILDPFSGSGTTLLAAQRTGRKARVIELDPRYVDVAVRRYQDVFGRAPRLQGSGMTLDELSGMPPRPGLPPKSQTNQQAEEHDPQHAGSRARPRRRRDTSQ